MTEPLRFTKRCSASGQGYLVWIPKDIVGFLKLTDKSYVEASCRDVRKGLAVRFTKRVARSGRGYLIWIPKDVSDLLRMTDKGLYEFTMTKLGDGR